ncbi:MAG: ankyrin repeat domain-containing protein [Alphaproteobacteria bacterium]
MLTNTFNPAANDNAPDPDRELLKAAEGNDIVRARLWLKKGADINARHTNNDTPLIIAAREGHEEFVKFLLTRPQGTADMSLQNNQGESALHAALYADETKTAQLLLKHGPPPDLKDEKGASAVFVAAARGHDYLIDALAAAKADLNAPDDRKMTPLMQAIKDLKLTTAAALLQNKANMDAQDEQGLTALMHAVMGTSHAMPLSLIGLGANIEIRNNDGKTALDFALALGKKKLLDEMEAKLREIYGPYHTGTKSKISAMRPLTLRAPGDKP